MLPQQNDHCSGDTILLAEDDENHVFLIRRSFVHARFFNPIQVVRDGLETIAYLNGDGPFADRAKYSYPALLLLDLKMPNADGFAVLEWIKRQSHLPPIRTVVLTTSDRVFDVKRAFALGAVAFLTKPLNLHDFIQLGPAIRGFWVWRGNEISSETGPSQQNTDHQPETVAASPVLSPLESQQETLTARAATHPVTV